MIRNTMRKHLYNPKVLLAMLLAVLIAGSVFGVPSFAIENDSAETAEDRSDSLSEAGEALRAIVAERDLLAAVYLQDEIVIRSKPTDASEAVMTVYSGTSVYIQDFAMDEQGEIWNYVRVLDGEVTRYGYVRRYNIATSDMKYLNWEAEYGLNQGSIVLAEETGTTTSPDIEQFPESYREALYALKAQHPNWTFVKQLANQNWDSFVNIQMQGDKSLTHNTLPTWMKDNAYDSIWYYSTKNAVETFMDPRYFLGEYTLFQFELLSYNEKCHTLEALNNFLDNTFMKGDKPAPKMDSMTYAEIFWYIGKYEEYNVSPFHLASRVYQEQGKNGDSDLISGTYTGNNNEYYGYYNFFNISATGKGQEVVESGLKYAKKQGWDNAYKSILGGTLILIRGYISKGQDTGYLQKFDLITNGSHQYMQNISAPSSEAKTTYNIYSRADALNCTFVFKIPVYESMPDYISVTRPEGFDSKQLYIDGQAVDTYYRNEKVGGENVVLLSAHLTSSNYKTATIYTYDSSGNIAKTYVWNLTYENGAYKATPATETIAIDAPAGTAKAVAYVDGKETGCFQKNGNGTTQYTIYLSSKDAKVLEIYYYDGNNTVVSRERYLLSYTNNKYELTRSYELKVEVPTGYTDTAIWIDGAEVTDTRKAVNGTTTTLLTYTERKDLRTVCMYRKDASGIPTGMYVWLLTFENDQYTAKAIPELENFLTYYGFSVRMRDAVDIRYVSGIDIAVRNQLIRGDIAGMELKEYGTIAKVEPERSTTAMTIHSANILRNINYGYVDTAGQNFKNTVFDTYDGDYRLSYILTGIPEAYYTTDISFRSYVIVTINGTEYEIYGPKKAKNVYELAKTYMQNDTYEEGTEQYEWLKQVVETVENKNQQ